jgi:hypothetical protein
MNAAIEVSRLLNASGAVLVRQNNHLVFRLPNGQNFVEAKTPGDPARAAKNNLSQLRRALGPIRDAPKPKGEKPYMPIQETAPAMPADDGITLIESPTKASLKERIQTVIATEEAVQEELLAEAQMHERRVQMLMALLPFAEEPTTENSLRDLLPAAEPPARPQPAPIPEPPQAITEHVPITRQLVFAATQTFDGTFTVNHVMDLMTGGKRIEGKERLRVRQSIAQAIVTLHQRGELIKAEEHYGRKQTVWRKVELNGSGNAASGRA